MDALVSCMHDLLLIPSLLLSTPLLPSAIGCIRLDPAQPFLFFSPFHSTSRKNEIRPCPTFSLFSYPFILHPETIRLDPAQRFLLFSPFTFFIQKKLDETLHNLFFTPPFLSSTRKKKVRDCKILLLFPPPFLSPLRKRDIQQIFLTATGDCNSAKCKCDISSEKHIARALFVQVL